MGSQLSLIMWCLCYKCAMRSAVDRIKEPGSKLDIGPILLEFGPINDMLLFVTGRRWCRSLVKVTRRVKIEKSKLFFVIPKTISVIPSRNNFLVSYPLSLKLFWSCRALSASVRWTKTICQRSRAPRPIRKCHESHVSGIGAILILNDPAPSLNTVIRNKKSASVQQADGPTNFIPIWPRQKIG